MNTDPWKSSRAMIYTRELAPGCPTLRIIVPARDLPLVIGELETTLEDLRAKLLELEQEVP